MANKSLNTAKAVANDEFYTCLSDIENECSNFTQHFKDQIVICNCDDPRQSNFVKYFMLKFKSLGLKRLIATCYKSQNADLFSKKDSEQAVYMIYDGEQKGNLPDWDAMKIYPLQGDGDFRSPECIELLKSATLCCSNPPFSLFEDYISLIIKHKKKFLVIGNHNASHYSYIFPLLKENKIWHGFNFVKTFATPLSEIKDPKIQFLKDGVVFQKFGNVCWYTNLEHKKRHEELVLYKRYNERDYPSYYNFEGIDVSDVSSIPIDYNGYMGVPDTFLDQYNPDQFELIGIGSDVPKTLLHVAHKSEGIICYEKDGERIWTTPYTVAERKLGNGLRINDNGLPGKSPYSRIIIRRKQKE